MGLQIHLGFEDVCLVGLTFWIDANKVCFGEVLLELLIVPIVLWLTTATPPITYVTPLMLLSAMVVEFIVPIETLVAEATVWMSLKSRLIDRSRIVIAEL